MFDAMRDYAVEKVWCSPSQDNQSIIKAQRVTRGGGELVSFSFMGRLLKLPLKTKYYHVYNIGQVNPGFLGLLKTEPEWATKDWVKFTDAMTANPLFCDIFTDNGRHIPLHLCYYKFTEDRSLIFCIENKRWFPVNLNTEAVYLRLYSNAYYQSQESLGSVEQTKVVGLTILSNLDIINMANLVNQWKLLDGEVFCFVNGILRKEVSVATVILGDTVEVYHDPSIKEVVELKVSDLHTFQSQLDSCYKYLLHRPSDGSDALDYIDDIDAYVIKNPEGDYQGSYLHRNSAKTLRMVTHRDYSLSVDHYGVVAELLSDPSNPDSILDFTIRLYIRHSGLNREMVYDANRLFELYRLSDDKIVRALAGLEATMPFWEASYLENAAMTRLFSQKYEDIDIQLIQDAFGYNAISKHVGDTPTRGIPHGDFKLFSLPVGLTGNATIFEYDAEGILLGYYHSDYAYSYVSVNETCEMIEVVAGEGTTSPDVQYGLGPFTIPTDVSFRIYRDYVIDGQAIGEWADVTDSQDYTYVGGVLTWTGADTDFVLMVRTDKKFLCYDLEITPIAGTIYFDLSEITDGEHRLLPVPLGDLDIWLNGYSCIDNLDTFVHFPRVYLVNKDYLKQPAGSMPQKITVRYTGFAVNDGDKLVSRVTEDRGFIVHGVLSDNDRYNLRDDKVLRISVKGKLKHRDQLTFSEEHDGVSVINTINGLPYQVKEMIVPLKSLTLDGTYELREKSLLIDKAVSDYMTVKLPEPERNAVSAMYNRHRLVSPFFSHLINDIISGQFDLTSIQKELSDQDVLDLCKTYEPLLAFDPINEKNGVDHRFVVTHPHQLDSMVSLDVYAYLFLKRVVKRYGRNLIDLTNHVNVINGG